jgi:large subunit ribosomal protein L15
MPLQRRVPKFGFKNRNRVAYKAVNLDDLQELAERKSIEAITPEVLVENGLAQKRDLVKILGRGELKSKLTITAHKFSATALTSIEASGGSASTL